MNMHLSEQKIVQRNKQWNKFQRTTVNNEHTFWMNFNFIFLCRLLFIILFLIEKSENRIHNWSAWRNFTFDKANGHDIESREVKINRIDGKNDKYVIDCRLSLKRKTIFILLKNNILK